MDRQLKREGLNMLVNVNKIRTSLIRRIAVITAFFLSTGIAGMNVHAHTPHDMVIAFAASPDYANDKTMFLISDGAFTGWYYDQVMRSTDGGVKLDQHSERIGSSTRIQCSSRFSKVCYGSNGICGPQRQRRCLSIHQSWRFMGTL